MNSNIETMEAWRERCLRSEAECDVLVAELDATKARIWQNVERQRELDPLNGSRWNYDVEFGIFELGYVP